MELILFYLLSIYLSLLFSLFLADQLAENIKLSGYTRPVPIQKYSFPIVASGQDLMSCAQTGSGKTGIYILYLYIYL